MIQDYTTRENGALEQPEGWMVTKSIAYEKICYRTDKLSDVY
jgi:hypothetical protein